MNFAQTLAVLCLLFTTAASTSCPAGSYLSSTGTCAPCPKGFAQPLRGQSGCTQCPPTSFTPNEGATSCTPCSANQVATPSLDQCECQPGFIPKEVGSNRVSQCEACPPGTYNTRFRSYFSYNICSECAENTFNPDPGQTECQPCPEGQVAAVGSSGCLACRIGEVMVDGQCTACPKGFTYKAQVGKCEPCDPGYFKPAVGNFPCIPCPTFMTSNGSAAECFKPCEAGKTLFNDGSCGTCPAGHYFSLWDKYCTICPSGTFMPYPNIRSSCFECAEDSESERGATRCSCRVNMSNNTCRVCDPLPR